MLRLNYIWRVFGTGLSFTLFGVGGLILSVIIIPLMFVLVRNQVRRKQLTRKLMGSAFSVFIRFMKSLGVLSYEISGLQHFCEQQNYLIIANHPTLLDVVFLVSMFPTADCVVKGAVISNPFMHSVAKAAKYISSDDPGELLLSCVNRLKEGASLILFPEGTRSVVGQELNFKLGAAAVATRSDTQILPVLISCSQEGFLAKDVPWYKAPPERPFISVQILAPIRHQIIPGVEINSRQETRDLNAELLSFYQKHLNHNNYS